MLICQGVIGDSSGSTLGWVGTRLFDSLLTGRYRIWKFSAVYPRLCLMCTNDESTWRRAHKVKRIAGHKSQERSARIDQHLAVFWRHDFYGLHAVVKRPMECRQSDFVPQADIAKRPEEAVAVSGDPHVAGLTRH